LGHQIVQIMIGLEYDVAAAPSVAAAGAAFGPEGFPQKGHAAFAAVPGAPMDFDFIDKHGIRKFASREMVNKKGEAVDLALRALPGKSILFNAGLFSLGLHIDAAALFVEQDPPVNQREQCPIASGADVLAGDEFRAALTHQNAPGRDLLAPEFFDAEAFADAVPPVANASLSFFMCHKLSFSPLRFDFRYFDDGQLLAMAHLAVITFAPFHFKRHCFHPPNVFHHIGHHGRLPDGGRTDRRFAFVFAKQHPVKRNRLTRLNRQAFNLNRVARADPVLLAPCFNYSIHM
jgi:hypothetical protein